MKKVLLCDDDKHILYRMTLTLTNLGWQVVTGEDCEHIIEKVAEHQPSVIIMDNIIPDIGGVETIKILKAHSEFKGIPVILYTSSYKAAELAEEAGAEFYYSKPIPIKNLEKLMDEAYELFLSRTTFGNKEEIA